MIRHSDFIKRRIGTRYVIVATGEAVKRFSGMLSINQTGSVIWDLLEKQTDMSALVAALVDRYDIDEATALRDAKAFLDALRGVGAVVDD